VTTPYIRAPYRAPYPPQPPQPPARRNRAKMIAIAAIALAAVGLLALVIVGLHDSGGTTTTTPAASPTTSAPTYPPSTSTDWYVAVCTPGSFISNSRRPLANAHATHNCLSPRSGGPIIIGEYTSAYLEANDAAMWKGGSLATITATDGTIVLFIALGNPQTAPLEPLAQFGFTVIPQSGD
jgi:hypothetical protein